MSSYHWKETELILTIQVKTNAKDTAVKEINDDVIKMNIKSPPIEGKANEEIIKFLSKLFQVPQSDVCLMRGAKSKHKIVSIISPRKLIEGIKK